MKVKDVINNLQTYPEDMEVVVIDANWDEQMDIVAIENGIDEFDEKSVHIVAKNLFIL